MFTNYIASGEVAASSIPEPSAFTVPLNAAAVAKLEHCRLHNLPFYLGWKGSHEPEDASMMIFSFGDSSPSVTYLQLNTGTVALTPIVPGNDEGMTYVNAAGTLAVSSNAWIGGGMGGDDNHMRGIMKFAAPTGTTPITSVTFHGYRANKAGNDYDGHTFHAVVFASDTPATDGLELFTQLATFVSGYTAPEHSVTVSPTTVTEQDTGGNAWTTPANIVASDGAFATIPPIGSMTPTDYLIAQQFGLAVPSGATIRGILVEVEWQQGMSMGQDYGCFLIKAGVLGMRNGVPTPHNIPPTTPNKAYVAYGGADDTWEDLWAPADVNATNFGVAYNVINECSSFNLDVDHLRVTVYYDGGEEAPAAFIPQIRVM
jgi:hypothetical protein